MNCPDNGFPILLYRGVSWAGLRLAVFEDEKMQVAADLTGCTPHLVARGTPYGPAKITFECSLGEDPGTVMVAAMAAAETADLEAGTWKADLVFSLAGGGTRGPATAPIEFEVRNLFTRPDLA